MFEFHGWARIESSSGRSIIRDDGLYAPDDDVLYEQLERQLDEIEQPTRECFDMRRTINGLMSLTVSGLRNHRDKSVFAVFEWLSANGARSTGVLFTRDDEDGDRDYDYENQFRVYRLSGGEFKECDTLFDMPANADRPRPEIETRS